MEGERKRVEEIKRRERERELEEIKKRYERQGGDGGGIKYKGRGVMKAPDERGGGMRGWD